MPTHHDLPSAVRTSMVALLAASLAEAIDLQLRAKHAHWNVTGPTFLQLHELYDKIADAAEDFADDLAERARALGGDAPGLAVRIASQSRLPAYDPGDASHLSGMIASSAAFARIVRDAIDLATRAGDQGTADLFTGMSREADKLLWFLESHTR